MTRETKIGLLVGLAFIIVIGILFSDYMTSTSEPPLAPLQQAGNNVRSGLGQPSSDNPPPVVVVPPNVAPRQTINLVGQDNGGNNQNVASRNNESPAPSNNLPANLREIAKRNGEDIVDVNQTAGQNPAPTQPANAVATTRTYKAEPGDSLSKIASKMYGSASKTNMNVIVAANASLKDNPNRVIVGKTYTIPPLGATSTDAPPVELTSQDSASAKPAGQSEYTYTVKSGDSLWSIATNELGDAKTIAAIKELNKDILNGSDVVRPNMKLKLPAKPVASAN
jgi:nucleoid-associated protein YgaU